jgi:hypothetical protein
MTAFIIDVIYARNPFGILSVIVLNNDLLLPSFLDVLPVGFEPYGKDHIVSEDKLHGYSPHGCMYSSLHGEGYSAEDSIPMAIRTVCSSSCDVLGSR